MGFEPTNAGTTIRCVNPFATIAVIQNVVFIDLTLTTINYYTRLLDKYNPFFTFYLFLK